MSASARATADTVAAQPVRCAGCSHFRNDPGELEREFPGLRSLGSAYGSTRAEDGICDLRSLYVNSRHGCDRHESRGSSSHRDAGSPFSRGGEKGGDEGRAALIHIKRS